MDRQTADQVVYIHPAAKDVISLSLGVPTIGWVEGRNGWVYT